MEISTGQRSWRRRSATWTIAAMLIAGLSAFGIYEGVVASSDASAEAAAADEPATVTPIGNTGLNRIVLIPSAIKRLDVKTAPVRSLMVDGKRRKIIPYSAVLYDPEGQTWVYTSPAARTFIRARITVDAITGNRVVLSAGPAVGMRVVTVGGQELYGTEIDY